MTSLWDYPGTEALRPGTRTLLEQCSGGERLMGAAPVWASIIIFIVIGFVVGFTVGAWVVYRWQRNKQRRRPEPYQLPTQAEETPTSWVPLRHKRNFSSAPSSARAGGPLGAGISSSEGAQHAIVPVDNPAFRASASLLNSHPGPLYAPSRGLVDHPAPGELSVEEILGHQQSMEEGEPSIKAYTGGTFSAPLLQAQEPQPLTSLETVQATKQAQKAKDAEAVGDAYDMDDLDDEWKELLCQIDARLMADGKQAMNSQERAIAIRSLLVSTARESPEQALAKAIQDIERFKRHQRK